MDTDDERHPTEYPKHIVKKKLKNKTMPTSNTTDFFVTKDGHKIKDGDEIWYSFAADKESIHGSLYKEHFNTSSYNVFKHKENAEAYAKNNLIKLSDCETEVIKTIKHHYPERLKRKGGWFQKLSPVYEEFYGYEFKDDEAKCVMFSHLLNIWIKIKEDHSGDERQLKGILSAAMFKSIVRPQKRGIDRAMYEIIGLIQANKVLGRYFL